MRTVQTKIPITDNPSEIKEHGLKLQNALSEVAIYLNAFNYMVDLCDAELSRIKHEGMVDVENIEEAKGKTLKFKEGYVKSKLRYDLVIKSPLKDDENCKSYVGNFNYVELERLRAHLNYMYNRALSKFTEIRSGIDVCSRYPMQAY